MKNFKHSKTSSAHKKSQKQFNDSQEHRTNNRVIKNETRSFDENGHILEQVLSDMAWYG